MGPRDSTRNTAHRVAYLAAFSATRARRMRKKYDALLKERIVFYPLSSVVGASDGATLT
jgi:hypothetical protein